MIKHQFSGDSSKQVESIEFADGSSLSITSADELVQAISAFGARTSSLTSNDLTDATQSVEELYNLASGQDLLNK